MHFIDNLKISARLSLGFGLLLVMLMLSTGIGVYGLSSIYDKASASLTLEQRLAQQISQMHIHILTLRRYEKDAFINIADIDKLPSYKKKWDATRAALAQTIGRAQEQAEVVPDQRRTLGDIARSFQSYGAGFEKTYGLIQSGQITSTVQANQEIGQYKAAVHDMESKIEALNEQTVQMIDALAEPLATTEKWVSLLQWSIAAICLALGGVLSARISRSITGQLGGEPVQAVQIANSIAGGDLTVAIETRQAQPSPAACSTPCT